MKTSKSLKYIRVIELKKSCNSVDRLDFVELVINLFFPQVVSYHLPSVKIYITYRNNPLLSFLRFPKKYRTQYYLNLLKDAESQPVRVPISEDEKTIIKHWLKKNGNTRRSNSKI